MMKRVFLMMLVLSGVHDTCAMDVKAECKGDTKRTAAVVAEGVSQVVAMQSAGPAATAEATAAVSDIDLEKVGALRNFDGTYDYIFHIMTLTHNKGYAWLEIGRGEKYARAQTKQLLRLALNPLAFMLRDNQTGKDLMQGDVVKILIAQRANVNAVFSAQLDEGDSARYKGTLLHWAALRGLYLDERDLDVIKEMVAAGADLRAKDCDGNTVQDCLEAVIKQYSAMCISEGEGTIPTFQQNLAERQLLTAQDFLTLIQEHAKKLAEAQSA